MLKRILITGGAGFIGSALARALIHLGHNVTAVDSLSPQIHGDAPDFTPADGLRFVRADVRSLHERPDLTDEADAIFHLAAETGTGQSMYQVARYVDVNEMGTAALLESIARAKKRRRRIILASSRSIYGEGAYVDPQELRTLVHPDPRSPEQLSQAKWDFTNAAGVPLQHVATPEAIAAKPGSVYAATKLAQEHLILTAAAGLNLEPVILRFQNVFGEGQSLRNPYTGIISIFYNRIRQGLPINVFEDGKESRDFVHVDDVVQALLLALDADKVPSTPLNVGAGVPTSVVEVAQEIFRISGIPEKIEITGDYRVGDIRHCYADLTQIQKGLGYLPKVHFAEGLARFVSWAKNQPEYEDLSGKASQELRSRGLAKG